MQSTIAPLLPAIESRQLAAIDRFNLLSDLFALIRASQTDANTFLALVSRCRNDDELLVWEVRDDLCKDSNAQLPLFKGDR